MNTELKKAVSDFNHKRSQYFFADPEFEAVAWHQYKAAEARVDALIKEAKEGRR